MVSTLDPGELQVSAAPTQAPSRLLRALLLLVVVTQAAHVAVFFLFAHAIVASNVVQSVAAALSAAVCLACAARSGSQRWRWLWLQLFATFLCWELGQLVFLAGLFHSPGPAAILASDIFWLMLALPLLVLAATPSRSGAHDPVAWLDRAQSCTLFAIMFVLIFPHPGIIRVPLAYDVENVALTLAVLLRFSIAHDREERSIYRSAIFFTTSYTIATWLDYVLEQHGAHGGTLLDLCWSIPFTTFSIATLAGEQLRPRLPRWATRELPYPRQLHGITAMGMALMSMAGSVVLAQHSMVVGTPMLAISFVIFAARTCTREWQLHSAHNQLEYTSLHDSLTGLPNRTMLHQQLTRLLAHSSTAGRRPALLSVDLDRFKTINDGLGYALGDLLLVEIGKLLNTLVGGAGLVARQGGDEFVVLLDHAHAPMAESMAQSIIERLRRPLKLEGRLIHVTASIGIVMSDRSATADSMLQNADCAMYRAKIAGKDRAQKFAPKMLAVARNKLDIETALRKALVAGEVEVYYQPVFALQTMSVTGFEALARWRHPERGMISPAEFIPIAEDTGLILELGRQVLWKACHQCQAWNEQFGINLRIAVNVSAHQFSDPGLLNQVLKTLRASRLNPPLLKLEVTESVLIQGYQTVEDVLTRARAKGIGICLDDFGTGYSSLSYLLRFPFDVVKIDRSFVQNLHRDPRRSELVRMIVQLARTLDKRIIAEGVETQEELEQLKAFDTDMVQGFLLSRPLAAASAEALLRSGVAMGDPLWTAVGSKTRPDGKGPGVERLPPASATSLLAASALPRDAYSGREAAERFQL